jgi:S1-C subfamily serine protease
LTDLRQGSASRAGLEQYDIILAVNGQAITDTATLLKTISDAPIGSTAAIDILRDGRRLTLKVAIEQQGRRTARQRG